MKANTPVSTLALSTLLSAAFGVGAAACKGEIEGGDEPPAKPAVKDKSNVKKLTTAVPYGKKVACADAIPDTAPFTEKMGEGIEIGEIKDKGDSDREASFVCSITRAGEPPTEVKELKTLQDKYSKLGVLPGDEYCLISAYCSLANDDDTFRRKCDEQGNQVESLDGNFACLRSTQKGAEYNYTFKFIEPDTRCLVDVMAGPSVEDKELVRSCASAAREAITSAGVANYK